MRNRMVLTIAAVAALLAGCGDGGSGPDTSAAKTSAPSDAPGTRPSDAQLKQGAPSKDAALTVTDIRIGHHPGFDRVVYELGGVGAPGWRVQYADRAIQDGSGKQIDVAGRSILEVQILGSAYPFDSNVTPYAGPDPAVNPAAPGITGVYRTLVFEGTTQSFIGVNADKPAFSVTALTQPTRLVIDIDHP
ncbi:hypothetical protein [Nocardia sp. NPDC052566]|uniref:AMIN-like domain-containing (lipo)protein n=1 Tax=Nocardia sp. NPDC052566 TaxID=3364330 RepID=UPI0037CC15C0